MSAILSLTESMIFTGVGDFLASILPPGVEVVQGQENLVVEPGNAANPKAVDFVVMWLTQSSRIETNTDSYSDVTMTGSVAGNVLTVTDVDGGTLEPGQTVFGIGLPSGCMIDAQTSGDPGLAGTYTLTQSAILGPTALYAGLTNVLAPMLTTMQLDIHGPNSGNNKQIVVALWRDEIACDFFSQHEASGLALQPLYIDEGDQIPFINGEGNYENRWVLKARLQANPVVSTPLQFADTLTVGLKEIDTVFPPGG